jgi:hypothetical protein
MSRTFGLWILAVPLLVAAEQAKVFDLVSLGAAEAELVAELGAPAQTEAGLAGSKTLIWNDKGPGALLFAVVHEDRVICAGAAYNGASWGRYEDVKRSVLNRGFPKEASSFPRVARTKELKAKAIAEGQGYSMHVWGDKAVEVEIAWRQPDQITLRYFEPAGWKTFQDLVKK